MLDDIGLYSKHNISDDIYLLVKHYSKDKLDNLVNEFRISYEDIKSFTSFLENSLTYFIHSRMNLKYNFDDELIDKNLSLLDTISLTRLGKTLSDLNLEIIDEIISKTKEIKFERWLTDDKDLRCTLKALNINDENLNIGGINNDILTDDYKERYERDEASRTRGYGLGVRKDKRTDSKELGGGQGVYKEIFKSNILGDEIRISDELRDERGLSELHENALSRGVSKPLEKDTDNRP